MGRGEYPTAVGVHDSVDALQMHAIRHLGIAHVVTGFCKIPQSLDAAAITRALTDGRRKYVWLPGTGVEQYFNLEEDPNEMIDLSAEAVYRDEISAWRSILVDELEGRPEGFVDNGRLRVLSGPTAPCLPGYEQE